MFLRRLSTCVRVRVRVRGLGLGLAIALGALACGAGGADDGAEEELKKNAPPCGPLGSLDNAQAGDHGGPAARSTLACQSGFTLCRVDPNSDGATACRTPSDCYACMPTLHGTPTVPRCVLSLDRAQPKNGGPGARSRVTCTAGYALCQVDPHGPDNDVCSNAGDCFACLPK